MNRQSDDNHDEEGCTTDGDERTAPTAPTHRYARATSANEHADPPGQHRAGQQ